MIEETIVERLLAWTGLTALIGARLDPVATEGDLTLPGVLWRRLSEEWEFNLTGTVSSGTWIGEFECWHTTFPGAVAIEYQLRLALNGWHDLDENVYVASTIGGADVYDEEYKLFGRVIQARIEYHE